jgi:nitrogen PTS system EIIA component
MPYRTFSLKEASEYLHLPVADLEAMVRSDEIPFDRQGDRLVFRKKDVDSWASQRILGLSAGGLKAYHKKSSSKYHDLSKQHAIIPELMKPEYIEPALTSKTKASVVRDMAGLAVRTGLVPNAKDLLNSLEERERLLSTALAGGVALLHPRSHEPYMFDDSFIVAGRSTQALPFGSPDGATTDLFFLVCCQDDRIHLHVLARICMMAHHTSLLLELREAADAAAMYQVMVASEEEVIRSL